MSIVQIIKRVASLGRDVARDAVDHNSEFIEQVAKRVEEVKQQELPKINQEIRNARVIGEMAIMIGTQKVQKMVDEFQNNSSDDKPNEH
jgi:glucuronate isomerase